MPGSSGVIGLFLRYLWPFIQEWFFDKKTAQRWLKQHGVALAFCLCFLIMTYCSFKILVYAVEQKTFAQETSTELDRYKTLYEQQTTRAGIVMSRLTRADDRIATLVEERDLNREKVALYESWMRACGMDYDTDRPPPRCTSGTSVRRPTMQPQPRRAPPPVSADTSERDRAVSERVQQIWNQDR